MEEYEQHEQPPPKKQKTSAAKRSWRTAQTILEILETSSDSELSQWGLSNSEDDLDFESDSDEGVRQEQHGDEQDDSDTYRADDDFPHEDDLPLSWEDQRKARRVSPKIELDP